MGCTYLMSWFLWVFIVVFGILLRYIAFNIDNGNVDDDIPEQPYDYIVVGSGSAGSIIARRLSEQKDVKILVLEAGFDSFDAIFNIPIMGPMLQKSVYDWSYETVPQKQACFGLKYNASVWPMGRIVGGTSKMNNMVYIRGNPNDYLNWYRDLEGFDYNMDILPYFKKLENMDSASSAYSSQGSIMVSDLPFRSKLSNQVLAAGQSLGYKVVEDAINSHLGFSLPKVTMLNAKRWSPSRLLDVNRITIRTNALVEKVLLKDNFEAFGVKYHHSDQIRHVNATRGVILAAGTIQTPKILMLSGIGHPDHLIRHGIEPRLTLPVGDNLQDHVTTGLDLVLLNTTLGMTIFNMFSPSAIYNYFVRGTGPWATVGCENLAFFKTNPKLNVPDLQFMILPVGVTSDYGIHLHSLSGISGRMWSDYFSKINRTAVSFLPILNHPRSRGTVRLKSNEASEKPAIDPNYLADDQDVEVLIKGIRLVEKIIKTDAMQKLGAELNPNILPGCEHLEFDSRDYWECYIRHLTITSYHPVGTCSMGQVVDYNFQVMGTNKLYVADGSVLPSLTTGNPNGAVMMMAEKAADIIKYHRYLMEHQSDVKEIFLAKFFCQ